jgi:hypothetical protein
MEPVADLVLVKLADFLHGLLEHLCRRVRVGGVLRRVGLVPRPVRLQELRVSGRVGIDVVADRVEDAVGVLHPDRVRVLVGERRRRRLEQLLRAVADLDERPDQVHAVGEPGRALGDDVRLLRGDGGCDRVEVHRLGRVDLAVDRPHSAVLELVLDPLGDRAAERVVGGDVRRGLRLLRAGQVRDPLREQVRLMRRRCLLGEEEVLEAAVEHLRRATRGLDVDHLVSLRDRRGGQIQERREGAEEQVDLLLVDQRVVVGDDQVLV